MRGSLSRGRVYHMDYLLRKSGRKFCLTNGAAGSIIPAMELTPSERQQIRDILLAVDSLLASEKAWTTDVEARDARGVRTDPRAEDAVCWCVEGAIRRAVTMSTT